MKGFFHAENKPGTHVLVTLGYQKIITHGFLPGFVNYKKGCIRLLPPLKLVAVI
jgi:hypothetical protein